MFPLIHIKTRRIKPISKGQAQPYKQVAKHLGLALSISIALAACQDNYAPMATVDKVEVPRYLGQWYEIALLPNRFQAMCVSDTTAEYQQDGAGLKVINRCRKADGQFEVAEGVANIVEGSNNAKLRVSFFRPFYGNYWILALAPDYQWVLVGEPSRQYGWVLSRTKQIKPEDWQKAMAKARELGYQEEQFKPSQQH